MLLILDRDGVINYDADEHIKSPEEWVPIPGSLEKISQWSQAGHQIVIATNQSGIARGLLTEQDLWAIHQKFKHELALLGGSITDIFYCPHHPDDDCSCRKPRPGLLLKIAQKYQLQLQGIWFIGDSIVDIAAARAVGCQPVLVKTGKGVKTLERLEDMRDILVFDNLESIHLPSDKS